jgi:hypothetical protein
VATSLETNYFIAYLDGLINIGLAVAMLDLSDFYLMDPDRANLEAAKKLLATKAIHPKVGQVVHSRPGWRSIEHYYQLLA